MVSSSAGLRCPDCAYARPAQTKSAPILASTGMSAFAGLLTGLAGAYVVAITAYLVPFLTLLVAPIFGRFVADAVLSFAGDERGRKLEAIGVASVLIGSFIALGTPLGAARIMASSSAGEFTQAAVGLSVGLAVIVCYLRLKPKPS